MRSYDPVLYHNLKELLSMSEEDIEALELDFTVVVDDLGQTKVIFNSIGVLQRLELKPGGASIRVTTENRVEYVLLFVDFHLSKRVRRGFYVVPQIAVLVEAMSRGVSEVIDTDWLSMFSPKELQVQLTQPLL